MPHYDEATLALLALGETQVTDDNDVHLESCVEGRDHVASLGKVVALGRDVTGDYSMMQAPVTVWERISAELDLGRGEGSYGSIAGPDRSGTSGSIDEQPPAPVVRLEERRSSSRTQRIVSLAAAAAVGVLLGAGGMWALGRSSVETPAAGSVQMASASLAALDMPNAHGTAVLRVQSAAQRSLTVNVSNLPLEPGKFYEVWLMDPTDSHLVALGVLGVNGQGAYVVPAGLDLAQYTAIDVSLQPMDGSPLHSKVSAVRGIMKA